VLNVAAGGSFSQILSNGISRARYMLICPFHSSVTHGSANAYDSTYAAGFALGTPMNSPYSSCPGTCLPYSSITNFNVLVSGSNLYQENLNYKYQHFLQEIRQSNSIQGGLQLGLSSGLISANDFENGYGFVYVDLSRKQSKVSDDISRSYQIIGTNSSRAAMDLYVIIGYEREINVSTATGTLII